MFPPFILIAYKWAFNIRDINDGLTHRYYGLYANLCKRLLKCRLASPLFWYVASDRRLIALTQNSVSIKRKSMLFGVINALKECFKTKMRVIILIDYPHSFMGFGSLPDYLLTVLLLRLFQTLRRIFLIVDINDPPIEHHEALTGRVSNIAQLILWVFINKIVLGANVIICVSKGYRYYLCKRYGIPLSKTIVYTAGSLPEHIKVAGIFFNGILKIIYCGNVDERISSTFNKVINVLNSLNSKGLKVELIVTGQIKVKRRREDLSHVRILGGLNYEKYVEKLSQSHVALLLYPKCLHNELATFTKLYDYISAGRMVISTNLLETRRVLREGGCGLIFRDFKELEEILAMLYQNPEILLNYGQRACEYSSKVSYNNFVKNLIYEIMKRYRVA